MRKPTISEIEDVFERGKWKHFEASLTENSDGSYLLRIKQMYEYVNSGMIQILKLCKLFETEDVCVGNSWHSNGCETCDYGSRYVVEFTIKDVPLSAEMLAWIEKKTGN